MPDNECLCHVPSLFYSLYMKLFPSLPSPLLSILCCQSAHYPRVEACEQSVVVIVNIEELAQFPAVMKDILRIVLVRSRAHTFSQQCPVFYM